MRLDVSIVEILNAGAGKFFLADWIIVFFANYVGYAMILALAGLVLVTGFPRFRHLRRKNAELFGLTVLSAIVARFGITELIRFFYSRPRPFEVLDGVRQFIEHSGGGSFPSGHAAVAFAIATAVAFYYRRTSIIFFAAALLIGVARVAAGLHWPTDILGGAVVGIGTAILIRWLVKRITNPVL